MAFLFDIRTLFLALGVISIVISTGLTFFWYHYRPVQGPFFWAMAMIGISIGICLIIFRGHMPAFFSIVIANTLILGGYAFILKGIRAFFNEEKGAAWEWLSAMIAFFSVAYFTFIRFDLIARIFLFSLIGAVLMFRCSYLLFKNQQSRRAKFQVFATASSFLLGLVLLLRAILTFLNIGVPDSNSFLSPNFITAIALLTQISTYISLTMGLVSLPGQNAMEELRESAIQLAKLNKELIGSEARFRTLSEASFEGILIIEKGKVLDANDTLAKMLGYEFSEIIEMNPRDFIAPEQQEEVLNKILSDFEQPYEAILLKKDGTLFPTEICAKKFSLKDRQVRVTAIRDLTEKKKADAEIKTLKGILPICSNCKKIRDDKGYWSQVEAYIRKYSGAEFSHGICPECAKKLYPDLGFYNE